MENREFQEFIDDLCLRFLHNRQTIMKNTSIQALKYHFINEGTCN